MADVKISALPLASTPLTGTEVLPIVQSATTDQVTVANLTAGRAVSASSLTLTTTPLAVGSGGTGLTTLTAANYALYSTSSSALTAGTLPVAAGGTGLASLTTGRIPFGAGTSAFGNSANLTFDGSVLSVTGASAQVSSNNNWNYAILNLVRTVSNTNTPRFIGMPLDGDSLTSTVIGGYNAIWGAYDSAPTTGSTSSALNGGMIYGAFATHRWYINGSERARISSDGTFRVKGAGTAGSTDAFLVDGSAPANAARIDASGNLLVGTTSADGRLTVNAATSDSSSTAIHIRTAASNTLFKIRSDGLFFTGLQTNSPYNLTSATAANAVFFSDGTFGRSTSSRKYKTEIQDAIHGLSDVLNLRSVTYKGKNDGDKIFGGLIAEEVDAIGLKEFVVYDDENRPDALAYGNMVSLAFKAIQELAAKVQALEAKVQ